WATVTCVPGGFGFSQRHSNVQARAASRSAWVDRIQRPFPAHREQEPTGYSKLRNDRPDRGGRLVPKGANSKGARASAVRHVAKRELCRVGRSPRICATDSGPVVAIHWDRWPTSFRDPARGFRNDRLRKRFASLKAG